ncbi:uncharacterized protein [Epargyreus clarus]|uniref:uncharacterized protein n=1 Tax=Epargyreus clarus TaxID=520877 RepID=UPI003C2FF689
MSRLNLRKRPRISYYEPEEPDLDEYVFCTECADYVYEYCAIHGPLLVIPDDKVPAKHNFPPIVPRAALTVPHIFLHLARSVIPGAGIGVFTTLTLPRGVRFGPYRGLRTDEINSTYCWQIYDGNKKPSHVIDAMDANRSNWMRYVNCSRHWCEQNLIAYQYQGQIYYRTIRIVPKFTELMVFYGSEFANLLRIDLKRYNSPSSYAEKMGAAKSRKSASHQDIKTNSTPLTKEGENAMVLKNPKSSSSLNRSIKVAKADDNKDRIISDKAKNCDILKENSAAQTPKQTDKMCTLSVKKVKYNDANTKNISTNESNLNSLCIQKPPRSQMVNADETVEINNNTNKISLNVSNKPVNNVILNYKLTCDICPYETTTEVQLTNHLKAHASNTSFDCNMCNYKTTYKFNLKLHVMSHTGDKLYTCEICKRSFSQNSSLKTHLRVHSGEKPFTCSVCNRAFNQNVSLKIHLRVHSGEKPFTCPVCNRAFNRNDYLKTHLRVHSGEKPFTCPVCNRAFNQNVSLKTHLRVHSGEKPFTCSICNRAFNQNVSLKTHLRVHSGEKPFTCSICNRAFNDKGNLKKHLPVHSSEKPFTCNFCEKAFRHRISLKAHLKIHSNIKSH